MDCVRSGLLETFHSDPCNQNVLKVSFQNDSQRALLVLSLYFRLDDDHAEKFVSNSLSMKKNHILAMKGSIRVNLQNSKEP